MLSKVLSSPFLRNVATVASGTAIAQAITVLASPILTRLYGPEAFGIFGVFAAVAGVIAVGSTMQLDMAMVLPKQDNDAVNLLSLSFLLSWATFALSLAVLSFFQQPIAVAMGFPNYAGYTWLLAFVMLGSVNVQILSHWAVRTKQFFLISLSAIVVAIVASLFKIGAGFLDFGVGALIVGAIIGYVVHACLLARSLPLKQWRVILPSVNREQILRVVKAHSDFPLYRTPQVVINSFSSNLPGILLASLFSPAVAGFYFLAKRVLKMPAGLISESVRKVFYPKAAEIAHVGGDLRFAVIKATLGLAGVGLVPLFVILVFGPRLFALVFGEEWRIAGDYARWLALWVYFAFINVPSVTAIPVIGRQRIFLAYEIVYSFIKATAIIGVAFITSDEVKAIAAYALVGMGANLILIMYTISMCSKPAVRKVVTS